MCQDAEAEFAQVDKAAQGSEDVVRNAGPVKVHLETDQVGEGEDASQALQGDVMAD